MELLLLIAVLAIYRIAIVQGAGPSKGKPSLLMWTLAAVLRSEPGATSETSPLVLVGGINGGINNSMNEQHQHQQHQPQQQQPV